MNFKTEYKFGETVYFKTDPHQLEYLVSGVAFRPGGGVIYYVSNAGHEERAYSFELSTEKTVF